MSKISSQDLMSLVDLFDSSDWKVLHLEVGDYEIYLSKDPNRRYHNLTSRSGPAPAELPRTVMPRDDDQTDAELKTPRMTADAEPNHAPEKGLHIVRAPSLGTFYRAPKPGADPYVEIGDRTEADNEICLVEVMKLFTTVHAGVAGVVSKIYASDGELVEFNQPLFAIKTND